MKLTTRGRYAVTAMLDIALHQEQGPVSLIDIAQRQNISQSYLEQLFAKLRHKKLVESVRGPHGGYKIILPLQAVNINQIVEAINEQVDATKCGGAENCSQGGPCLTHDLWAGLSETIADFLQSVTLESLMNNHSVKKLAKHQDERYQTIWQAPSRSTRADLGAGENK